MPGKGYEFVNEIVGGSVPKEFIKPIDQGIQEALEGGVLAGYPMVDVKVELYDGSYHDVDSNEMAFKIAGSMAFKEAARKASPVLLEPVMSVEVVTPEDYAGVIMGDLSSRRGPHRGHGAPGGLAGDSFDCAAGRNVWLRHAYAVEHPGPRGILDALRALRRSAALGGRRNYRQGAGK